VGLFGLFGDINIEYFSVEQTAEAVNWLKIPAGNFNKAKSKRLT
jgi:hypothetical protein